MSKTIALKEYIRLPVPENFNYNGANYYLDGRGPKIGVLIALDDKKWGWSLISPEEDLFATESVERTITVKGANKVVKDRRRKWNAEKIWEMGTFIAIDRALGNSPTPTIIPKDARQSIENFQDRMKRYFKN